MPSWKPLDPTEVESIRQAAVQEIERYKKQLDQSELQAPKEVTAEPAAHSRGAPYAELAVAVVACRVIGVVGALSTFAMVIAAPSIESIPLKVLGAIVAAAIAGFLWFLLAGLIAAFRDVAINTQRARTILEMRAGIDESRR